MVCPTCGLDNDPAAAVCARCNSALAPAPVTTHYAPPPPPTRARPNRLPLIAGVSVLLVALAVAAGIYMRPAATGQEAAPQPTEAQPAPTTPPTTDPTTQPTTTPTTPPTSKAADPRAQLTAIDAVLSGSVASRRKLNQAIEQVGGCDDLRGAVADIRAVGDERRSQMDTVRGADLSAVPTGEDLRSALVAALQYAYDADQGFLAWAEPTLTGGCGAADDAGYTRGRAASTSAGTAKRAFLARWNPLARANGLRTRSADDI
ncbi:hypothetical protein [Actinoplanes sp. CA-252034]|uniref:hypothetical protein n=1 Tax=Actinoplanes sp. CA-252034 TaxID=3239906 RepID=UPI003D998F29